MTAQQIAAAMQRVEAVMRRRPDADLHDDAPATARWGSGTRIVACPANGARVATDMPRELGGSGDEVTPGWLFRAGAAACTATRIAMAAAQAGITLDALDVVVGSRSDTRGLLGLAEADGRPVPAAPHSMEMRVAIAAHGVSSERLRALVDESYRRLPVACAIGDGVPLTLRIETGES